MSPIPSDNLIPADDLYPWDETNPHAARVEELLTREALITHRAGNGEDDAYGVEQVATTTMLVGCELQQRQRDETTARGDVAADTWLLVVPAGTQIGQGDTVLVEDQAFKVDGEPWIVRAPRSGDLSHIEATVKATTAPDDPHLTGS